MQKVMVWSCSIGALVALASVVGLVDDRVYGQETDNWAMQAMGQDVGNLLAVVVLIAAALRFQRGSHRAGLVWLGTMLYLIYAYIVYAMAVHLNGLFLVYVAVLGLSSYAVIFTVPRLRASTHHLPAGPVSKAAGITLIAIATLFAALWLGELVPALLTGVAPKSLTEAGLGVNPIHVIDLAVVLPGFIMAGVGAVRGRPLGSFWTGPWLMFSALMGASIIVAMLLMLPGSSGALMPLVMVSLVVVASVIAGWRHITQ